MPINVLVYDGPGVSQTSLSHTIQSLRTLLVPNYTVNTISPQALINDPWPPSCALLVIPGGRDLPYVAALEKANSRIRQYVQKGGSFLGICAGAYYASANIEWEVGTPLEVTGKRNLGFFPGTSKGCVYKGFVYESEDGARAIDVMVKAANGADTTYRGIYYNGGGLFDKAEDLQSKGVRVLATYPEGPAAAVVCDVSEGRAILWGPHLEYPLVQQPASATIAKMVSGASPTEVNGWEKARLALMKKTLESLGLHSPYREDTVAEKPPSPLAQMLCGSTHILEAYRAALQSIATADADDFIIQDSNDRFHIHDNRSGLGSILANGRARNVTQNEISTLTRDIILVHQEQLPNKDETPAFSMPSFQDALQKTRSQLSLEANAGEWGMGEAILYGEVVTSTQTLFDKNPNFMRALPSPLLSLASFQLTGRGRGSNVWLSPAGCLQFSLLLRPPNTFRPAALVFIQYIFGLAVVEACRRVLPGSAGERVRLKWPNDVYVKMEDDLGKEELKKIGGILVTTNFSGGLVDVVIGCGINVLNARPTTSLSQLSPGNDDVTMENVAGTIMPVFERMWNKFLTSGGSFQPFLDLYLTRWLHSDQEVTLTTVSPPQVVRIVGITSDYGLLRTLPVTGGSDQFIDLQPDGNSFDMMAGLIRLKT